MMLTLKVRFVITLVNPSSVFNSGNVYCHMSLHKCKIDLVFFFFFLTFFVLKIFERGKLGIRYAHEHDHLLSLNDIVPLIYQNSSGNSLFFIFGVKFLTQICWEGK
jgi:hypothetical protein